MAICSIQHAVKLHPSRATRPATQPLLPAPRPGYRCRPRQLVSAADGDDSAASASTNTLWVAELLTGQLWDKAQPLLPAVPWRPQDLLHVMATTSTAGAAFAAANLALQAHLAADPAGLSAAAAAAVGDPGGQLWAGALQHVAQEGLLLLLFPAALWLGLEVPWKLPGGQGPAVHQQQPQQPQQQQPQQQPQQQQQQQEEEVVSASKQQLPSRPVQPASGSSSSPAAAAAEQEDGSSASSTSCLNSYKGGGNSTSSSSSSCSRSPGGATAAPAAAAASGRPLWCSLRWQGGTWLPQSLLLCGLVFPLADPLLAQAWQPAAEALFGPPPPSALVDQLQAAVQGGHPGVVLCHLLASGVMGPAWEEMFWRGFFLTALTKVLPPPACVAASALNFATLHLSPSNWLPLLLLGGTADVLYLRSGANLAAPLLLHVLWNSGQVLGVALLGKESFV